MKDPFHTPLRSNWLAPVVAAVALLLALGTGYYAIDLKSQLSKDRGKLMQVLDTLQKTKVSAEQRGTALSSQLQQERAAREGAENRAREAELKLNDQETELAALRAQRQETMQELREFQVLTAQFRRMIDSGKLEVVFRRGRMVVKMPAAVLFPSGSAELSDEGKKAVRQVARILRRYKHRRFTIGGHTDSVPIKNADYKSNWELSAARSVTVTQRLIDSGMRAPNLVAAGFASHDPIASNKSRYGRSRNRRIEIVLEPYLRQPKGFKKPPVRAKKSTRSKKRRT